MKKTLLNWLVILLIVLGTGVWGTPASAAVDSELEAAVLQIIQQHPDAVLQSLLQYQQSMTAQPIHLSMEQAKGMIGSSPVKGNLSTATALIFEFSDFQCPYCAAAHPSLQAMLNDHQQAALIYKNLPLEDLHPQAIAAASAAWAAGQQGAFWQYHDALFEESNLEDSVYLDLAQKLLLDLRQFDRDRSSTVAKQAIQSDVDQAEQLYLTATPVFLVVVNDGSYLVYGANLAVIESLI